jgi:hypothetical protein
LRIAETAVVRDGRTRCRCVIAQNSRPPQLSQWNGHVEASLTASIAIIAALLAGCAANGSTKLVDHVNQNPDASRDLKAGTLYGERDYNTSSSALHGVFAAMTPKQIYAISDETLAEIKQR